MSYAFSMADTMLPFRELLKPSNKFHWDDTLQQAFEKSKLTIIDEIHLIHIKAVRGLLTILNTLIMHSDGFVHFVLLSSM